MTDPASISLALLAGFGFAFAESGLGVGMFLPGETVVVVLASGLDPLGRVGLLVAVALGAFGGDHVGYLIGRRFGPRLRETRLIRRMGVTRWDRAVGLVERYGVRALVGTRLLPVVRTLTPAVAGAGGLAYRRFVLGSLAGSILWSVVYVGGGAVLGEVAARVYEVLGLPGVAVAGLLLAAVAATVWRWNRRRRSAAPQSAPDAAASSTPPTTSRSPAACSRG